VKFSLSARFSAGLLVVFVISLCACHKAQGAQALAEGVAETPCVYTANPEKYLETVEERLDRLKQDDSQNADQALVMLMGYYLGEHNGEELVIEIARRGNRMKPLLIQEQRDPAKLSTCAPRNKVETVKYLADEALRMIDQSSAERHPNH
jgi:hypothetical protein